MNFINQLNEETKKYFDILCNHKYPKFINKYINTKTMQRLKGVGLFCGMDYTNLPFQTLKYWYSRLDHSIACALMTWHFTGSKVQTLAALFHDLGTPAFSHCIDYMFGDALNHESSEKEVRVMLENASDIKELLKKDKILIDELSDIGIYPIVENKKPKICVDRLEGIFSTGMLWGQYWQMNDIEDIYKKTIVCVNEDNNKEIGFIDIESAEKFYFGAHKYSMMLQNNDDKITMSLLADIVKLSIDNNLFTFEDLYHLPESYIIDYIKNSNHQKILKMWNIFANLTEVYRSDIEIKDKYCISLEAKKKFVNPLCIHNNKAYRLIDVSENAKALYQEYMNYKDTLYVYIDYNPNK